ncbi:MAG: hypothetical protein ACHQM6_09710 [Candidatus Kapaibacterium sp.]
MKTCRTSFLSVAAFLMVLCSTCIVSREATACPVDFGGPTTFNASPGESQTQTWTVSGLFGGTSFTITAGSDVFTVSPVTTTSGDSGTFKITFRPGANASGVFNGMLTCPCNKTIALVGAVTSSGVANSLPGNVSVTLTPNPATDNITIVSSGVRTAEIGIYDLLGEKIASLNTTNVKFDV